MIYFHFEEITKVEIKTIILKNWIKLCANNFGACIGDINYIFSSDEYLLEINKKYLKHNYYTDIITFNYNQEKILNGDIYISIDRVKDNAKELNVLFDKELNRVMIHGILHLIGFDDRTEKEKKIMRSEENNCLSLL